jgi:hypothetical protein
MSFLALPFLFPILVIAAIVLCPIDTTKLIYGCITGYFKEPMKGMTFGARVRSLASVFAICSSLNVKRRLGQIGNAVMVTASWLVVLAAFVVLVIPGILIGAPLGIAKFIAFGIYELVKVTSETVEELIGDALDAAAAPANRSIARR